MAKVIVFGATGGTGRRLVDQALAAGYEVVAYARDYPKSINASTTTVMARSAAPIIRYLLILSSLRRLPSAVSSIPVLFTSPQTNSKTRAIADKRTMTVANCSVLFSALS